jgi:hypothetical protein
MNVKGKWASYHEAKSPRENAVYEISEKLFHNQTMHSVLGVAYKPLGFMGRQS